MTAMYCQFFPWLVESTHGSQDCSPVDWQRQHSTSTSTAHYERILDIPHALNMPRDKAIIYVKISRTLQAVYNLALPDDGWSGHQQSPYLLTKLHEAAAFSKAQALICIHYRVGGDYMNLEDCNRNEKRVNDILDAAPYLLGPTSQVSDLFSSRETDFDSSNLFMLIIGTQTNLSPYYDGF
ncbi:hypothetical protein C8R48DRAFT_679651 [Suillus tomentosus]|nr:hypothetical protein C8R48DRAFT_679651 [Suillus tomentosus]